MRISSGIVVLVCALAVSGCVQKNLRVLTNPGSGPDEFLVLPNKPLTPPTDFASLPAPTPGGNNLTDPTPQADLVASLGGKPSALQPGTGIPAGDGALVTAASRFGVDPNVRETLAKEDAKQLKKARRSGKIKLVPVDRYELTYRKQALNPTSAADQFRRAGIATPSAPPKDE